MAAHDKKCCDVWTWALCVTTVLFTISKVVMAALSCFFVIPSCKSFDSTIFFLVSIWETTSLISSVNYLSWQQKLRPPLPWINPPLIHYLNTCNIYICRGNAAEMPRKCRGNAAHFHLVFTFFCCLAIKRAVIIITEHTITIAPERGKEWRN